MILVTRTDEPVRLIPDDVIAQFVEHDSGQDMPQDLIFPVLYGGAVETGEQVTCAIWAAATYTMEGLPVTVSKKYGDAPVIIMPRSPVFKVATVLAVDKDGQAAALDPDAYAFVPADPENRRPWGFIRPRGGSFSPGAASYTVTGTIGWDAEKFPRALRTWALIRMATLYDYREDLVTGTITANMPRDHAVAMLDRWRVYGDPYA